MKENNFHIGQVTYICENLNSLHDRFSKGKRIHSKPALTWGNCLAKSEAGFLDLLRRLKPLKEKSWNLCFSKNRRNLSNVVYHYYNAWDKTELRILNLLNSDNYSSNEILTSFKMKAYLETTNINIRARDKKDFIKTKRNTWRKSLVYNQERIQLDFIQARSSKQNKSNWNLAVKEAKIDFSNLTKDRWKNTKNRIIERLNYFSNSLILY